MAAAVGKPVTPSPSGNELAQVMAKNDTWRFAGEDDGWWKSHDSIRRELKDVLAAIDVLAKQTANGKALEPWQVKALQKYFPGVYHAVHHHHDMEEQFVFPFMATKVTLPPKMADDHATLMTMLEDVNGQIKRLTVTNNAETDAAVVSKLQAAFRSMEQSMEVHLKEEEMEGLPILRKYFTPKEFKPVEKKIIADQTPEDMGRILRSMPDDKYRRYWMTEVANIPGIIQILVLMPAYRKFERKSYNRTIGSIIRGMPPKKKGFLGISF